MTNEEIRSINHSYEMAVRNMNSRAWSVMLPTEKIQDLQAIENKNAMDQNRIACEVRAEPMQQGAWGYHQGNQIVINSNELDNPEYLEHVDTVFHEGSHARDEQAQFIREVQSQYTPEQLAERSTAIPDPETDPQGYWSHPAEVAAREAGEDGVDRVLTDREHIIEVDRQMSSENPVNQILQTYDYNALEMPIEPMQNEASVDTAQSVGMDVSAGMDGGIDSGMDA